MSRIFEIADRYVDEFAALDPNAATASGITGHEAEMTDYSPDGAAAIDALNKRTAAELATAPVEGERDRIARNVMTERLGVRIDAHEAGENLRALRIIGSPLQGVRNGFDQMPRATQQDWQNIATRLNLVPGALDGFPRDAGRGAESQHAGGAAPGARVCEAGCCLERAAGHAIVLQHVARRVRRDVRARFGRTARRSRVRRPRVGGGVRGDAHVPGRTVLAARNGSRCIGPGALSTRVTPVQRQRTGSGSHIRMGLGRAVPRRARDGGDGAEDRARRQRR